MRLELKDIKKSFGDKEILHGITFEVESGRAMGFLGRNGAGKTTTIRCLMDVFKPDSGHFVLDGRPFRARDHRIGYLPEERGLYAKEELVHQLVYFAQLRGMEKAAAKQSAKYWLSRVDLSEFENKRLEILSKGNQQKVQIIQALIHDPDIIILDEPFSGLDPVNSQVLKDIVREKVAQNKLVIFCSHQMGYVEEFCDDIALIDQGTIILEGDLSQIKRRHGRGKYRLISSIPETELATLGAHVLSHERNGTVIELCEGLTKDAFLRRLLDHGSDIQIFAEYQPSLTQVFIHEVGEKNGGDHE
ncbi:MAG TPA: ATP-binding cassette domain-containing protein [Tissierellia bacterium]|nr:ATP-binding cassette domain-containing protein [Tissierellia bacterium]